MAPTVTAATKAASISTAQPATTKAATAQSAAQAAAAISTAQPAATAGEFLVRPVGQCDPVQRPV